MQIRIKIPRVLARLSDRYTDWANVELWRKGRFDVRRGDVVVAVGFVVCVSYYWYSSGWWGALAGALMYVLAAMIALWFF
jgi:hypothetical protein